MRITGRSCLAMAGCLVALLLGCSEDDANEQLIGAICATEEECDDHDGDTMALECLTEFKGGYCGRSDCTQSDQCPEGSVCVVLETKNYCFLVCRDKSECNQNRPVDFESNCSSNVNPVEGGETKVCVPPAAGS